MLVRNKKLALCSVADMPISKVVAFLYEEGFNYNSTQIHMAAVARGLEARKLPDTTKSPLVVHMIVGAKKPTFFFG